MNKYTRQITLIFKHAVSRELIEFEVFARLQTLEPLGRGQTEAKEYRKREPADLEDVRAAAEFLSPPIRAILTLQLNTGMRPSEVFNMRPMDIDRSGEEWFYRPEHHKTEGHGVEKAVPIVGPAREALTPFLLRAGDAFCFSPKESAEWYREQRRANGKGRREGQEYVPKADPKRAPGLKFNKDALNRAVVCACEKAGVKKWTPYQLRHTAATEVCDAMGIDAARALLGHTSTSMTERYAKRKQDEAKAIAAAKVAPSV